MKLRYGWTAHTGYWRYKESRLGFSIESVVRIKVNGVTKYEAHYRETGCCGFANSPADLLGMKRFDSRDEAFDFCEAMYKKRMEA